MTSGRKEAMRLSVILPVYAETQSVIDTVEQLEAGVPEETLHEIIIVISPKSGEESFRVCEGLRDSRDNVKLHVQQNNPGLGWAIREAFELVTGTHALLMGSDLETDPAAVRQMIEKMQETGCDIVTANRWSRGGGFAGYSRLKLVCNYVFQKMLKLMFLTRLNDMTYGFRIMPADTVRSIRWQYTRHEFLLETILKPLRLGARIEEVPVKWISRTEGESKNTFFRNFNYLKVAFGVLFSRPSRYMIKESDQ
ncbi:MAG TPA: glycosyltransferase family 2 protein [Armatimonadota bacterium]|nr:glycosyltransferase family 2 protein [Armatimonadota bacterium]